MRTTDVRKLRPEAWGFICPVHTPDGGPCGLLNHMTAACRVVTEKGGHFTQVFCAIFSNFESQVTARKSAPSSSRKAVCRSPICTLSGRRASAPFVAIAIMKT